MPDLVGKGIPAGPYTRPADFGLFFLGTVQTCPASRLPLSDELLVWFVVSDHTWAWSRSVSSSKSDARACLTDRDLSFGSFDDLAAALVGHCLLGAELYGQDVGTSRMLDLLARAHGHDLMAAQVPVPLPSSGHYLYVSPPPVRFARFPQVAR